MITVLLQECGFLTQFFIATSSNITRLRLLMLKARKLLLKGKVMTVDILVLTCLDQLILY
jgi:hypothetical protein